MIEKMGVEQPEYVTKKTQVAQLFEIFKRFAKKDTDKVVQLHQTKV